MAPRSIRELTADSCVFLTGVTGFVGGCLLERICKQDPGPARIFVLVRRKRGMDPSARLQKIFASPLFSGVPARKLGLVKAMEGDVGSSEPNLGLSDADIRLLVESCTHIFHSAAFISFAAQLDRAIEINLRGSRFVLELARKMKKLRAMVHVSTAYANCTLGTENSEFAEKIYPADVDPVELLNAANKMLPKDLEAKYGAAIRQFPNTYAFTKRLTENLLACERGNVPLAIVRPGVILNSWREPFPGWVDNVNSGACGFIAGAAKGIFCTIQARGEMVMDVIPVDLVISTLLAAALKVEREPAMLHVLHCTSGTVNPTTWEAYCAGVIRAARRYPSEVAVWYPRASLRESRLRNDLVMFIFQMLPAYIIHIFAKFVSSTEHNVLELQRRYARGNHYTSYFGLREWQFARQSADELIGMLPEEERDRHPIDPRLIDWDDYFEICVVGTRSYFHKEPAKTTARARFLMALLRVIATLVPVLSFAVLFLGLILLLGIHWMLALPTAASLILLLIWL